VTKNPRPAPSHPEIESDGRTIAQSKTAAFQNLSECAAHEKSLPGGRRPTTAATHSRKPKQFHDDRITGLIVTKLDGSGKGGVFVRNSRMNLEIRRALWVGTGREIGGFFAEFDGPRKVFCPEIWLHSPREFSRAWHPPNKRAVVQRKRAFRGPVSRAAGCVGFFSSPIFPPC